MHDTFLKGLAMDTQTKTGLAIAAALIAAFFVGGIAFTFAGGMVRAFGPMHDGAPFAVSAVRAYDHGPMMDEYGRFGAEYPRGAEYGDCGDIQFDHRGGGMRFAPQDEVPEGYAPGWMHDGERHPYDGERPVQPEI